MPDEEAASRDPRFAEALAAVANPVRLRLLRQLRRPKALKDLRVNTINTDGSEGRSLARQTIKEHLEKLVQNRFVSSHEAEREYGATMEYVLNQQALYALAEEFRELAALRPEAPPEMNTMRAAAEVNTYELAAPCLVLVKGVDEGHVWDLKPEDGRRTEWIIGRRRGLHVPLDFDPFVSTENARIVWEDGSYFVQDLEESRNGTYLNFKLLPKGGRRGLRTGDLIGVGRTLLMLRE